MGDAPVVASQTRGRLRRSSRLVAILVVALAAPAAPVAAAGRGTALVAQPAPTVEAITPRLSVVAPDAANPISFRALTPDGAHLVVAGTDLDSAGNPSSGGWDVIAQRVLRLTPPTTSTMSSLISPDGQFFVFRSSAQVVPDDTDIASDLYLGTPSGFRLVTVGATQSGAQPVALADDGSRVLFETDEALSAADADNDPDMYLWSSATNAVTLETGDHADAKFFDATPNLESILFSDLGVDAIWERTGGATTPRISHISGAFSPDGSQIYSSTSWPLLPDDVDGHVDAYESTPAGIQNLTPDIDVDAYVSAVSADQSILAIATTAALTPDDLDPAIDLFLVASTGTTLVTTRDSTLWHVVGANDDLSRLVIETWTGWVADDTDGLDDFYRWDASDPTGITLLTSGTDAAKPDLIAMTPDGGRILIQTEEAILPEAGETSGKMPDLFEWDGDVLTQLTPDTPKTTAFAGASADLSRVVFWATDPLLPADTDLLADLYVSDRDQTPPIATIHAVPGGVSGANVTIQLAAIGHDAVWFDCQLDGGAWTACPASLHLDGLAAGTHALKAYAFDAAGNRSTAAAAISWLVDRTGPVVSTPVIRLRSGPIDANRPVVRVSWAGSDAHAAVARYEVSQSVDGGPFAVISTAVTSPFVDRRVAPGHDYRFRVRGVDAFGNIGAWRTTSLATFSRWSDTSATIRYSRSWTTSTNTAFWGGHARSSSTAGATARWTGQLRSIGLVSRVGPNRGKARIYINGTLVATIDLRAATASGPRIVWTRNWSTRAIRTITIRVLGTAGRPRIDLDDLVTMN